MEELKPCPFCGGEAMIRHGIYLIVFWVECQSCGVESNAFNNEADAIEAWNRRV